MIAHQRRTRTLFALAARGLAALALATGATACASLGSFPGIEARPTIAFENAASEPVRVYLVETGGGDYLLGNVYPMERASLRVPAHMTLVESRQLTLVVVPLSRYASASREPAAGLSSPTVGSLLEIAHFRWIATPAALHYERGGTASIVR